MCVKTPRELCELAWFICSNEDVSGVEAAPVIAANIFGSDRSRHLRNILCRAAFDVYVREDQPAYGMSITKRRCGLKIEQLNEDHKEEIKRFLENNTVESS